MPRPTTRGRPLAVSLLVATTLCLASNATAELTEDERRARADLPEHSKWRVSDIFESGEAWESERASFVERLTALAASLDGWTASPSEMLRIFQLDCELERSFFRLVHYADLNMATETDNSEHQAMQGRALAHFDQWQSIIAPMEQDVIDLGVERFREYRSREPGLDIFAFRVERMHSRAQRTLPPELGALVAKSLSVTRLPEQVYDRLVYQDIRPAVVTLSDGREQALDTAALRHILGSGSLADRRLARAAYLRNFGGFEQTFAALVNGVVDSHRYLAEARGYTSALDARFLRQDLEPDIYHMTIRMVREYLPLFHRYSRVKQRLLGADELLLGDVYAPLPKSEAAGWSFDRARDAIVASLAPLGAEVVAIAERAFGDGWIDVYPHAEKRDFGGVTNVFGVHPYILLNFKGGFDDVYVATHELGHAIQFWLTDEHQPCVNSSTSSFLFEIAAHFNEHLLVDHLLRTEESVGTRRFLLDKQATGVARAIFTQTMLAELELAMHEEVEAGGTLTADWLNDRYLALSREYYGHAEGAATVGDHEKHGWIPIPHLYMDYYVVNYATGMVASLALHHQLDKNPAHGVEAYVDFLKSGGSDFPLELLESAGIDMTTREPFEAAFAELERLVVDLELSLAAGEGGEASVGATP